MKILVAYDTSAAAEKGLYLALEEARVFKANVHAITSADRTKSEKELPNIEAAEQGLSQAQAMFEKEGITCSTHLLIRGLAPGEDIVQYAKENSIDRIIVGVKKQSKVGKLLLGSTAQYVILKSTCPVLSVKA
jgi:nucleotide-binding universal stress UspA family protein